MQCPTCDGVGEESTPCNTCGGDGRVRNSKKISLRVPAGAQAASETSLCTVARCPPLSFIRTVTFGILLGELALYLN